MRNLKLILCVTAMAMTVAEGVVAPSPRTDPLACGYGDAETKGRSVCSPDGMMTRAEMAAVDVAIAKTTDYYETGVVVLKTLPDNFAKGETRPQRAERLARMTHDAWGVGDAEHGRGILFFIAVDDRVAYISVGKGVRARVSERQTEYVIELMKPYLRDKNYGAALETAVLEVHDMYLGVSQPKTYSHLIGPVTVMGAIILIWLFYVACVKEPAEYYYQPPRRQPPPAYAPTTDEYAGQPSAPPPPHYEQEEDYRRPRPRAPSTTTHHYSTDGNPRPSSVVFIPTAPRCHSGHRNYNSHTHVNTNTHTYAATATATAAAPPSTNTTPAPRCYSGRRDYNSNTHVNTNTHTYAAPPSTNTTPAPKKSSSSSSNSKSWSSFGGGLSSGGSGGTW
jgi:uncharacterized membrane protein YgcG